jgi:hypothetical protein
MFETFGIWFGGKGGTARTAGEVDCLERRESGAGTGGVCLGPDQLPDYRAIGGGEWPGFNGFGLDRCGKDIESGTGTIVGPNSKSGTGFGTKPQGKHSKGNEQGNGDECFHGLTPLGWIGIGKETVIDGPGRDG